MSLLSRHGSVTIFLSPNRLAQFNFALKCFLSCVGEVAARFGELNHTFQLKYRYMHFRFVRGLTVICLQLDLLAEVSQTDDFFSFSFLPFPLVTFAGFCNFLICNKLNPQKGAHALF